MSEILLCIEIIGVISFAISGAMVAIDKESDFLGVVFLSLTTSFGGGIIRDVLIGKGLPIFFTNYLLVAIAALTAVSVFVLASIFKKKYVENERFIAAINNYFDAAGLGVFAVSGAKICMDAGYTSPLAVIFMGMISSIGGSMIRDFALNVVPFFLRKRIYVLATIVGASLYYVLFVCLNANEGIAMIFGAGMVFIIRILATVFKLSVPKAIDFSKLKKHKPSERK